MTIAMLQHRARAKGYVTQALIDQHGSFRAAVDALNAASLDGAKAPAVEAGRGGRGRG